MPPEEVDEEMVIEETAGWWSALGAEGGDVETKPNASSYAVPPPPGRASFSYETQEDLPVDGSSAMARKLSPFTLRILPPSLEEFSASFVGDGSSINVDQYQQAGQTNEANNEQAASLLASYGISSVSNAATVANSLNQQIAVGSFLNNASGHQVRTTLTDATTAADIAAQIAQLVSTPPLTLLVNPQSMNISYTGIQSFQDRGREGFIFQRWGEDQPSIKFAGKTGAFIAGESSGGIANAAIQAFREYGTTQTPTGVQFASKRNSAAFQNFQSLYQFYRNNGYIYDRVTGSEAHLAIGTIAIDYDQFTYIGHIESFEYAYDTSQIHAIEWSMEFRVSVMYDNAETPSAVLPLESPIPSPSSPIGGGRRGNAAKGWLVTSGDAGSLIEPFTSEGFNNYVDQFGQPPAIVSEGQNPIAEGFGSGGSLTVNPDGTPTLTNPNAG